MPPEFDPDWEYREDDPEIAEAMAGPTVFDPFQRGGGVEIRTSLKLIARVGPERKPRRPPQRDDGPAKPRGHCPVCKKEVSRRRLFCSISCSNSDPGNPRRLRAARRVVMITELVRAYGTLTRAVAEAGVSYTHASRALKAAGSPAGYGGRHYRAKGERRMLDVVMTAEQARLRVLGGTKFGDVYPFLAEADRAAFREWFVREPGVAVGPHEPAARTSPTRAVLQGYTGDSCGRCGAMKMRRTGPCLTCDECGSSDGGCG